MAKNKSTPRNQIYRVGHENLPHVSEDHKRKIALLKLTNIGIYVRGVGIRDENFFVLDEDENE